MPKRGSNIIMQKSLVFAAALLAYSIAGASAEGVGRIVRIPTPIAPKCINAKTDEITITFRYIKTQKVMWFLTEDKKAGVTVIATLNSDGNQTARNPSVNLVSVEDAGAGQIYLPLEYPVASLLALSSDSGKTFTKNMELELYLDKLKGANTFGQILDDAGALLPKLPIPANPYLNAISQVVTFATDTIKNESVDSGGQLFASVTLQFEDRDQPNIAQCLSNGFETTGAIAVIGPKGADGEQLLPLDKLSSAYCWRYVADTTYEIQYAPKPTGGCGGVKPDAFKDVPNDYVMMIVAANTASPPAGQGNAFAKESRPNPAAELMSRRALDLAESKKLCDAMKLAPIYCGIN
jgi:hypothetical protein